MKKNNNVVKLKNVSKKYDSPLHRGGFYALKKINLEIKKGSRVGIMGPNGAGKTTLLKIISGVTTPSSGKVIAKGRIVSLIDLEAGFEPDLTGRENVFVNGLIIGMEKEEIEKKFDQIIEFADIGKFIDLPFFTYSSGMKFRLAFAIAIASDCDVLIIDEIFQAGDFDYKIKTMKKIKDLQKNHPDLTTIVCSHLPLFMWSFADVFYHLENENLKRKTKKQIWTNLQDNDAKLKDIMG